MENRLLFLFFYFLCFHINAQNADAIIHVENEFEKTCGEKGIRDGFLSYVDSSGIVLTKNGPVNANQFWSKLPAFDGLFSWSPAYAEMSLSGNWGYTTGNYEHRPKTSADSVNESGQYTTVWQRTENGEWKYLIDIGNQHPHGLLDKQAHTIIIEKYPAGNTNNEEWLNDPEKEYIHLFEKNIHAAYQKYSSDKYLLNLTGNMIVTSGDSAVALLEKITPSLKFHPSGVKISPGKDMAAVYGNFGLGDITGNYLRIWRHEKKEWKIALEVIKF